MTARIRLPYRPPYDWDALLAYLRARAIPGVEAADMETYRRGFSIGGVLGWFAVRHAPALESLIADVDVEPGALPLVAQRLRRMFDVGCDIEAVAAHLAPDPMLGPLLRRRPGLRAFGAWDGFELAVRAVLGQQISVAAARGLALRLVVICGRRIEGAGPGIERVFPDAACMAAAELGVLGMPGARRAALRAVAEAACASPGLFDPEPTLAESVAKLRRIPGVGEWTAQYVALRALRHADAFPASDLALLRAAAGPDGARPSPRALLARAEAWRPYRAYAAQHLWAADPMIPGA